MLNDEQPRAHIEQQIILTFKLPGVNWMGHSGSSNESQLEERLGEEWRLKVSRENMTETLACLRAVVTELERFEQLLKESR